jgi:hypothetical protein
MGRRDKESEDRDWLEGAEQGPEESTPPRRRPNPALIAIGAGLVFMLLLACAWVAAAAMRVEPGGDPRSRLRADYGPWQFLVIAPISQQFLQDAARSLGVGQFLALPTASSCLFEGAPCTPSAPRRTATGDTPVPTRSVTPTPLPQVTPLVLSTLPSMGTDLATPSMASPAVGPSTGQDTPSPGGPGG